MDPSLSAIYYDMGQSFGRAICISHMMTRPLGNTSTTTWNVYTPVSATGEQPPRRLLRAMSFHFRCTPPWSPGLLSKQQGSQQDKHLPAKLT